MPDNAQYVEVLGQAELRWLQRGAYVSFTGIFNSKGVAQAAIKDMQVFQPNKETKLGIQMDGIAGANKELFGGEKTEPSEQTARYLISGRLVNIKDSKFDETTFFLLRTRPPRTARCPWIATTGKNERKNKE